MRTVRAKLVALVLACVAPALGFAVYRAHESEADLLEQTQRRVRYVEKALDSELADQQSNARLALALAGRANKFHEALKTGDAATAQRLVDLLASVYKYRGIVAADAHGKVLATGNPARAPTSLGPDASPAFAALLAGKPVTGFVQVKLPSGPPYALVQAEPIMEGAVQVGALAVVTPVSEKYLEYLERKLNADLALKVNEKLVAHCADHPDPELEHHGDDAVLEEARGKLFALRTFEPARMKRAGLHVEVTASRDVTALRDESRKDLLHTLLALGGISLLVLALALRVASRMGKAVQALAQAASSVKAGKYATVAKVRTGDELELLGDEFNAMVQGLQERDRLKDTFGRYVTKQVAEHLMQGKVALGGELLPVTVLFSDIRSFTTISEHMEPKALLDFLNEYFSGMVESVMRHGGVVDKFIGDAIMAVFGAPVPSASDPLNAIHAALAMRERLVGINVEFRRRGLPELRTGIGLHYGQVVAGNMGHVERMEYTVIGDTVNLASRLESMTKELRVDVILSEDLFKQVEQHVEAEPIHQIKVKGRHAEVMVYKLIGLKAQVAPTPSAGAA